MSEAQQKYKQEVERAGGDYLIVRTMTDLISFLSV